MTVLLQLGIRYGWEMASRIGHVAGTLAGVNYESKGSAGCIRGSAARGATNTLFRHTFYITLTDSQAAAAKRYADACVGEDYVWGGVPSSKHGGDCSGYMSGIICAAEGHTVTRLFGTDNWPERYAGLGFHAGLGPAAKFVLPAYPGRVLRVTAPMLSGQDVRDWQHAALLLGNAVTIDGMYGPASAKVCRALQTKLHLSVDGEVGPKTWAATRTAVAKL